MKETGRATTLDAIWFIVAMFLLVGIILYNAYYLRPVTSITLKDGNTYSIGEKYKGKTIINIKANLSKLSDVRGYIIDISEGEDLFISEDDVEEVNRE